ncbi:MAG: barstar family protein [Tetrasphaera sp.]
MTAPGVRRLGPDTAIATLVQSERADGRVVHVVPAGDDKAETLRLFAEVLHFPDYFGHNLDALWDCVRDVAARQDGPWSLIWDGARFFAAADPVTHDAIVDLLDDLARRHPAAHTIVVDR